MNFSNSSQKKQKSELNIKELESDIIKSVTNNMKTFISRKTGSGKSTQVPQYLYNYLLNKKNNKNKSFNITILLLYIYMYRT